MVEDSTFDRETIREQRTATLWLEPEHISCMLSDVRRKLLFALGEHGPCSISQLAGHMQTYAEALYHHMRLLLASGLIREVGTTRSGAREQMIYDATAQNYNVKEQPWDPDYAESCVKMFQAEFNIISQQHGDALRNYGVSPEPMAFIGGRKIETDLDPTRIEELKGRLQDLDAWSEDEPEGPEKKRHTIFIAVHPCE